MLNLNIANILTICRIAFIPFFVALYHMPLEKSEQGYILAAIFVILSATDWLDGFLARKLKIETPFGRFLDPVADKILVIVALMILVDMQLLFYGVALILILREVIISALRSWLAEIHRQEKTNVSHLGKIKTACQMISISMFFLYLPILSGFSTWANHWLWLAKVLIYIACAISLYSMSSYLYQGLKPSMTKS
jgi:CDP-diacylglycerol--glycerol-3-phosphate 3-phosphatidyltransferase